MLTIAYLANQFPSPVEPYVAEEIEELRRRGIRIVTGSVRRSTTQIDPTVVSAEIVVLQQLSLTILFSAFCLCIIHWRRIAGLMGRVVSGGTESPVQRLKTLVHTWLGACYAAQLKSQGQEIHHIHVHHGYFGSWIAMVAAGLLGVGFSMTLHGSDLLLHKTYLDVKLDNCQFCRTVSDFNRHYILRNYPALPPNKILIARLGVDADFDLKEAIDFGSPDFHTHRDNSELQLLSVGRLHPVKDHAFLVRVCAQLRAGGLDFKCSIAGDGPERKKLEVMIRRFGLEKEVALLGHVPHHQMDSLYERADVVVLTSRSEGIPLVLMEAMSRSKIVLAPGITGIPELIIPGKTGFLYDPGSMGDCVARLMLIRSLIWPHEQTDEHRPHLSPAPFLDWIRHGARVQIRHNFNRKKNLKAFGDLIIQKIAVPIEDLRHENLVLQQV